MYITFIVMAYMKKASGKSMKMSSKMTSKGKEMKSGKVAGKEMSFMDKMKAAKAKKK